MTEKKPKHIHKFKRLRYKSGNEVFFCALPDCNCKMNPALLFGKRSICWRCGNEFIMNEYALRLAKPHCEACHRSKNVDSPLNDGIDIDPLGLMQLENTRELSLSERLSQTIKQAEKQDEEEL